MRRAPTLALLVLHAAGYGCGLFARASPPPPARGVVLVLASGFSGPVDPARAPTLARLAARGRAFESAFAPEPGPAAARSALLGSGPGGLVSSLRDAGLAVAAAGPEESLPLEAGGLDLRLSAPVGAAASLAALEPWLRSRAGPFALLVAIGPAPSTGEAVAPVAAAERLGERPGLATSDAGFADRPGATVRPAAWSLVSRQRAEADALERTLAAEAGLRALLDLVERAAPGAAVAVVADPPGDRGGHGVVSRPPLEDDTLRATLVVSTPGLARPGRPARAVVSTADLGPVLLALVGAAPPGAAVATPDSTLWRALADPAARGGEAVASTPRAAPRVGRSLRTARWRYSEWPDGSTELYDHERDPTETANLAARPDHAAILEEMRRVLWARESEAPSPARPPSPPRARSVLLVIVDDLNTRLGAWGADVRTPNVDRLAARGVRFGRAYAQVAMCNPSRSSMLTGWSPLRTGVWHNEDPSRPQGATPLAELLSAHGRSTVAIGKVLHQPERFRFDVREEHPEADGEHEEAVVTGEGLFEASPGRDGDQPDGQRALRAARLLGERRSRPFLLVLGLVRPHQRWIAPARYFDLYPPASVAASPYPADDLADVPAIAVKTRPQPLPGLPLLGREPPGLVTDEATRRQAIAAYQACTTFADAQLGLVLDALDRHGLWRDTVVVLVGDNGFHLGEHGGLVRKDTLFEEALRVPLIVAAPGLPQPGAVVGAPVELLDVYPTVAELLGVPVPAGLDGRSLVPLLDDPGAGDSRGALSYRRVRPPERGWSLRTATARYTLWPDGSEELRHPRADGPAPDPDLAARPERAAEKQALRDRLEALVAPPPRGRER
jgi:arylsulfatase A-like enzyme